MATGLGRCRDAFGILRDGHGLSSLVGTSGFWSPAHIAPAPHEGPPGDRAARKLRATA
ncbi:hypothetical protein TI01_1631 [Lysobacter sp. A03]|nr:hypothetical protein TI01_1631 [Lysobacter sp. A03]